jgi:hypothetical protein
MHECWEWEYLLNDSSEGIAMRHHEDGAGVFALQLQKGALKAGPCGCQRLMHAWE